MTAPHHPTDASEVVSAFPSWAERWEAFRSTGYWREALLTIAEEARGRYEGDPMQDERFAVLCEDAATTADTDERVMLLEEVEAWFTQQDRDEAFAARCYSFEQRTRKPWDAGDELWREAFAVRVPVGVV